MMNYPKINQNMHCCGYQLPESGPVEPYRRSKDRTQRTLRVSFRHCSEDRSVQKAVHTWADVAAGVLVPGRGWTEGRGTHFGVAQDAAFPAGAARALVQLPRLPLHVKLPAGGPAHHQVHPLRLSAARLIC